MGITSNTYFWRKEPRNWKWNISGWESGGTTQGMVMRREAKIIKPEIDFIGHEADKG